MNKNIGILIATAILVTLTNSAYTISMTEQGVVTQFGKPVNEIKNPGLYFKIPFIQKLTKFSNQLLDYEEKKKPEKSGLRQIRKRLFFSLRHIKQPR